MIKLYETTDHEQHSCENAGFITIINIPVVDITNPTLPRPLETPKHIHLGNNVKLLLLDNEGCYWISALCVKRLSWSLDQLVKLTVKILKCAGIGTGKIEGFVIKSLDPFYWKKVVVPKISV